MMNKLEVGKRYISERGDKWECIAIRGEKAWLAGICKDEATGSAYTFTIDGKPICLWTEPKYAIKQPPVTLTYYEDVYINGGGYGKLKYQTVDGEFDPGSISIVFHDDE